MELTPIFAQQREFGIICLFVTRELIVMSNTTHHSAVVAQSCPVLKQMSPGMQVEVNGGTAELFVARGEIGAISGADIAERAGYRATHALSVFCNGGLWARRDLYFVDSQGTLVGGYRYTATMTHGECLQELPSAAAEFGRVVDELAGKLLSMPKRP